MQIDKRKPEKITIHTFVVRGEIGLYCGFPMDMLRLDKAWPASTIEAAKMKPNDSPVEIKLEGLSCTPERWKSFGWEVL